MEFLVQACALNELIYRSVVAVGELRRGVALICHRGGKPQARLLESWQAHVIGDFADDILDFEAEAAQM